MASLLSIDLGLKTGLAAFAGDGRLLWYRSRHFGSPAQLRRRVPAIMTEVPKLDWLVLEGGGPLAEIWQREGERRNLSIRRISADDWREDLFYPRQHADRRLAKRNADDLARRVITWSGAAKPTSLVHDAAEAILVGFWMVLQLGWLPEIPAEFRP